MSNEVRSFLSNHNRVGVSESRVARKVQTWFTGEHHSFAHDCAVPRIEPGWFMAIQTDSVARVMSMRIHESRAFNRLASCLVNPVAGYSRTELFESCVLGFQHPFKVTLGPRAGFPNNHGSFKLARVAPHFHSGLCNKNVSSPNLVPGIDCMRNRGVGTDLSTEANDYWRERYLQLDVGLSEFLQHSGECIIAGFHGDQGIGKTSVSIFEQDLVCYLRPFRAFSKEPYFLSRFNEPQFVHNVSSINELRPTH